MEFQALVLVLKPRAPNQVLIQNQALVCLRGVNNDKWIAALQAGPLQEKFPYH